MKSLLLISLLVLPLQADVPCKPEPPKALPEREDIGGYYEVRGVTEKDEPYSGVMILAKHSSTTYTGAWLIGNGLHYTGIGLRSGDSVSFSFKIGDGHGVITYQISGKTLSGRYLTMPGNGTPKAETLKFLKGS